MINSFWLVMALHWVHSLFVAGGICGTHQHLGPQGELWPLSLNRCRSQPSGEPNISTCQTQSVALFSPHSLEFFVQSSKKLHTLLLCPRSMDLLGVQVVQVVPWKKSNMTGQRNEFGRQASHTGAECTEHFLKRMPLETWSDVGGTPVRLELFHFSVRKWGCAPEILPQLISSCDLEEYSDKTEL